MYKGILTTTLILLTLILNAQQKNDDPIGGFMNSETYLTGSLRFSTSSNQNIQSKSTTFNIAPSIGYFTSDNLALEASVIFGIDNWASDEFYYRNTGKTTRFGGEISAYYYFQPEKQFSFIFGGGVAYVTENHEDIEEKTNVLHIVLLPGVNYFISNKFAIRAIVSPVSYVNSKSNTSNAGSANAFNFNLNLSSIRFGAIIKL